MKVMNCIPCLMTGGTEIQTLSLVKALVAARQQPSSAHLHGTRKNRRFVRIVSNVKRSALWNR